MAQDFPDATYNTPNPLPVYTPNPPRQNNSTRWIVGCLSASCLCLCLVCCGMPILTGTGIGIFAAVLYSNGVTESDTQTFRIESAGSAELVVDMKNAEVIITPGTTEEITITYELTVYGITESQAKNSLQDYDMTIDRSAGDQFQVNLQAPDSLNIYDVKLTITAPPQMELISITTTDDITIDGVTADFQLTTETRGYVTLTDVDGTFEVNVTGLLGEIRFGGSFEDGSTNTFRTGSGEIDLAVQDADNLSYTLTSSGSITCPVATTGNTCQGDTGGLNKNPTTLQADSGGGSLYLRFVP